MGALLSDHATALGLAEPNQMHAPGGVGEYPVAFAVGCHRAENLRRNIRHQTIATRSAVVGGTECVHFVEGRDAP